MRIFIKHASAFGLQTTMDRRRLLAVAKMAITLKMPGSGILSEIA
jgi:hypothetical protein